MAKIPRLRLHKSSGRAVVTLNGKDVYLGVYGSPEADAAYEREIGEWLARNKRPSTPSAAERPTVNELVAAYLDYCDVYYAPRRHGKDTLARVSNALSYLTKAYGPTLALEFGPKALKAVRQRMVAKRWSRTFVNACVRILIRCFRWGVSEEMIGPAVLAALEAVEPLSKGMPGVKEGKVRLDVSADVFWKTMEHLHEPLKSVAIVQWQSGMRPGEVLTMRPADLDRREAIWVYRPREHKCDWRGQGREVLLDDVCQKILAPLLDRDPEAYIFDPATAPRSRVPHGCYVDSAYRQAVWRACLMAGVPKWTPYQLRHGAATRLSALYGQDIARRLLGQKSLQSVSGYDHLDLGPAREALRKRA